MMSKEQLQGYYTAYDPYQLTLVDGLDSYWFFIDDSQGGLLSATAASMDLYPDGSALIYLLDDNSICGAGDTVPEALRDLMEFIVTDLGFLRGIRRRTADADQRVKLLEKLLGES